MTDPTTIHAYVPEMSLAALVPFLLLLLGAIGCLVVDATTDKAGSRRFLPIIAGTTLLATMVSFFFRVLPAGPFIEDTFIAGEFAEMACLIILFATFVMTVLGPRLVERRNLPSGEFYTLILFTALGMILLAFSNELLTAFISLEIMSLSLYVLTGIDRRSGRSIEASFKYFLLGAFASAFFIFGVAFLFGATGTTRITEMAEVLAQASIGEYALNAIWVYIGFALILVGICFKLSLAPFHMWAPDVYQGANTPTTMIIATASKVSAMVFFMHLVYGLSHWDPFHTSVSFIIGLIAVTSMVWGNLAAVVQTDFKRMMAYSSVSHTGYMMVGVLVLTALSDTTAGVDLELARYAVKQAILLYLAGYTIMNVLAFGVAFHVRGEGQMSAYRGLVYRKPAAALGMGIAMFSLVGIGFTPPTIGFMGKFYLFKEAVQHGFVGMAVIAVSMSVVSAYYYLSLVVTMFMREQPDPAEEMVLAGTVDDAGGFLSSASLTRVMLGASGGLIFIFGVFPGLFLSLGHTLMHGLGFR